MAAPLGTLRVGCPVWAHAAWRGNFFTRDAARTEFLPQYASVFPTSEGNSTFYGLPSPAVVARWAVEAPEDFRFCLKFPRVITHDLQLVGAEAATAEFLERVRPLGPRLGTFFLQLHASFGPRRLQDLDRYLAALPRCYSYAVEVRHPEFFVDSAASSELQGFLQRHAAEWVTFDTRGLFASSAQDSYTVDAKRKKPRLPLVIRALSDKPFVRFVGDPEVTRNDAILQPWAEVVVKWLREGRSPYFFTHHPDDTHAPALAARFHGFVRVVEPRVPPLATFPVQRDQSGRQIELF